MKCLNNKAILLPKKEENEWGYEDKDAAKLGTLATDFKGEKIELKEGDEVYYQYGTDAKIEGVSYVLVSENNLICLK